MRKLIIFLVFITITLTILPWGQTGHRIVADIAEQYLSEPSRVKLRNLLEHESLAQVSTWPDEVRSISQWNCAAPLHYVSVEKGNNYFDSKMAKNGDIIRAIVYFANVAGQKGKSRSAQRKKKFAVKWLVHLIADLHQPLHVGGACDRGGNKIKVSYFGRKRNIHQVWDESLIDYYHLSYSEFSKFIHHPSNKEIKKWQNSSLIQWVIESQELRKQVYTCYKIDGCSCPGGEKCNANIDLQSYSMCENKDAKNINLGYRYQYHKAPVARKRMLQAGIRLGFVLNEILANRHPFAELEKKLNKSFSGWADGISACLIEAQAE